jgi:hypothetical protein
MQNTKMSYALMLQNAAMNSATFSGAASNPSCPQMAMEKNITRQIVALLSLHW